MEREYQIMISDTDKRALQVGFKQTMRALAENHAKQVFLALDSDNKISVSVREACESTNTPLSIVETMKELGKMCEIEVGASCAVVLK